jgi:hypothetical protein
MPSPKKLCQKYIDSIQINGMENPFIDKLSAKKEMEIGMQFIILDLCDVHLAS